MSEMPTFVKLSSLASCRHLIMDAAHYRDDGSCRCDDPDHEMNKWGYIWDGSRWCTPEPSSPRLDPVVLQRLADALARHDALAETRQEINDLYEQGDFHAADPMVTALNDDLAPMAGEFASAVRDLLGVAAPELLPTGTPTRYAVTLTVAVEADSADQAAEAFGFHLSDTATPTVTVTNLDTGESTEVDL